MPRAAATLGVLTTFPALDADTVEDLTAVVDRGDGGRARRDVPAERGGVVTQDVSRRATGTVARAPTAVQRVESRADRAR